VHHSKIDRQMAEMGQTRSFVEVASMSALPPLCGLKADISRGPRSAITSREQMQQHAWAKQTYSITSSAATNSLSGTVRPSAFAVLRLMANSNFTVCWTGKSPGFSPLRIRPA
jgi:hypothetical protein